MKILFFINTLKGGGAEKLLVDLINKLPSSYDIYLYTLVQEGVYLQELPKNVKLRTIISSKNRFISTLLQYLYVFILPSKLVYKLFIKDKCDVEVAFLEGPTTKILSRSTNKDAKKIAWVHYDLYHNFTIRKMYPFMYQHRNCYRRFDYTVCICNEVKENFKRRFGFDDHVIVINNFINYDNVVSLSNELYNLEDTKIHFVSIGRLVDDKGFLELLTIYNQLNGKYKSLYDAKIIGSGEKEDILKEYIKNNNLDNVEIIPFTQNPYVLLKNSNYFISSSKYEGFGLVILEALALNVPVIATETSGSKEILKENQYGIICSSFSDLYIVLEKIMNNKLDYTFSKTDDYAKKYDINAQIKKIVSLFEGGYDEENF